MVFQRSIIYVFLLSILSLGLLSCKQEQMSNMSSKHNKSAADFLGNPDYKAMSYGGYRTNTRDDQPSVAQIKEDLKILDTLWVLLFSFMAVICIL